MKKNGPKVTVEELAQDAAQQQQNAEAGIPNPGNIEDERRRLAAQAPRTEHGPRYPESACNRETE